MYESMKHGFSLQAGLLLFAAVLTGQSPIVETRDWIVNGRNFDVDVERNRIYLISDHYYELDLQGNILYTNSNIDDTGQGTLDFGPAIEVGPDGAVHMIHRDGGIASSGFNLMYSRRDAAGTWSVLNQLAGSPVERNYVVDIVALGGGEALYAHSRKTTDDVWGSVYFYGLDGTGVTPLGGLGRNDLYRVDSDFRMEQYQGRLHIATGKPDSYGVVYYMDASIGPSLAADLTSGVSVVKEGSGRKGQPDLRIDASGNVFVSYGDYRVANFRRYSNDGSPDIGNKTVLDNLGYWHLDLGMSALAASPSGDTVVLVGLETDGSSVTASTCVLRFGWSMDGGQTWSDTGEIPSVRTHGGEGRSRPRVQYYGNQFYVFYNVSSGGIAMTTIRFGDAPPPPPPPPPVELVDPVDLSLEKLCEGQNFDVEVANDRIYIISDHYYEYNLAGARYAENTNIDDTGQGSLDFSPALAVGPSGEVHVVTRNGGDASTGFNLKYSRKQAGGTWDVQEQPAGNKVARNYVVDVVALSGGEALVAHSELDSTDSFGTLNFLRLNGTTSNALGDLGRSDLYRVDGDFRMERAGDKLHLATAKPVTEGMVYYMEGTINASLVSGLVDGILALSAGTGKSGQPDLRTDGSGNAYLTYGSAGSVLFNRFNAGGSRMVQDVPVFHNMGTWKLDLGLSAVSATPGGDTLLAVGLKTDGSTGASSCSLYYAYSLDGGTSWVYPVAIPGFLTSGGEGRMRPRIRYYMGRFYLFFNNVNGGIAVKTIDLRGVSPLKAATPVILPAADSVDTDEPISISSSGSESIHYSFTDGSPDMLSGAYTAPFTISAERTIHAIAYRSGYLPSDVVSVTKKIRQDEPPPVNLVDPVDLSQELLTGTGQFDVEVTNKRIYLVADHYYEFNLAGTKIAENDSVYDLGQGSLDFGPALSVGPGGEVHVITRGNGNGSNGFEINYSRKEPEGDWNTLRKRVGLPMSRNYVVDVVPLEGGDALYAHSVQIADGVYGSVFFYTLSGTTVTQHGDLGRDDLYRIDSDFRMESFQGHLHLATGKPDPDGSVYYMHAPVGGNLPAVLAASSLALREGSGRRGQPDLRVDGEGKVQVSYGSDQTVIYTGFSADGTVAVAGTPVIGNLGTWHLDLGLSALASSPDGDTILVLGLKTDGTKEASSASLYYTYSLDGGQQWIYPLAIDGILTNAGEGRMRPKVRYYMGRFYLFFNNSPGGISVKTLDLRGQSPLKAAAPQVLPEKDSVKVNEAITLQATDSDAIHYSFDDPEPDMLSTRYTGPFTISQDRTIHAVAFRRGYFPSDVVSVTKKIEEGPPLVDPVDLTVENLAGGKNFDVEVAHDRIYLISDHYYEFDLAGNLLSENTNVLDRGQGTYDFGPALSVGKQGEVHVITRNGGNGEIGFNLMYSSKDALDTWTVQNRKVGAALERNYVVDVVDLEDGKALYAHSLQTTDDVWGSVYFYTLDGMNEDSLGGLERNDLYRIDSDFRMERFHDRLHIATGKPDPVGAVYYMNAAIGGSLAADLAAGPELLSGGTGRRGQPDLRIDTAGNVFLSYGSEQAVLFHRYSADGSADVPGVPVMSNLGSWHLDLGLSALAASPGGDTMLVAGLKTDGSKGASSSTLLFTYSFDGGRNWVYPVELTGYLTDGGEGRMRPRVRFHRSRFYIFYNNASGGIAVTTIDLRKQALLKMAPPLIFPEKDSLFTYETLSISAPGGDAVFYTVNDPDPDLLSLFYRGPFILEQEGTIYARAYRGGYLPSDVVSASKALIITSVDRHPGGEATLLKLYPVPASDVLSMELEGRETGMLMLRVFNAAGQWMHADRVWKPGTTLKVELDVTAWPEGIYTVQFIGDEIIGTKRFIKGTTWSFPDER